MGRPISMMGLVDEVAMEARVLQQQWDPRERQLLREVDVRQAWLEERLSARGMSQELAQVALSREALRELIQRNETEDHGHDSIVELAARMRRRHLTPVA